MYYIIYLLNIRIFCVYISLSHIIHIIQRTPHTTFAEPRESAHRPRPARRQTDDRWHACQGRIQGKSVRCMLYSQKEKGDHFFWYGGEYVHVRSNSFRGTGRALRAPDSLFSLMPMTVNPEPRTRYHNSRGTAGGRLYSGGGTRLICEAQVEFGFGDN